MDLKASLEQPVYRDPWDPRELGLQETLDFEARQEG